MSKIRASILSCCAVGLISITALTFQSSAEKSPAKDGSDIKADAHMQPLARYVGGQWVTHAKWADGSDLHAREVHQWGLDGKIITSKTFVTKEDGSEYQRYETISAWHRSNKQLTYYTFTFDGTIDQGIIETQSDGSLLYPPAADAHGKRGAVRQTIKFIDDNTMLWTVFMQNDQGAEQQLIQATWKREAMAKDSHR